MISLFQMVIYYEIVLGGGRRSLITVKIKVCVTGGAIHILTISSN